MPLVALSDLDRRALAHLSIPRNVTDLTGELTRDPHSPVGPGQAAALLRAGLATEDGNGVLALLEELEKQGWVVDLGETEDHAALASQLVDGYKGALPLAEESGRIYSERLAVPGRQWRTRGTLWMLTEDGLAKLKEPVGGTDTAMDMNQLWVTLVSHESAMLRDLAFEGSIFDQEKRPGDGLGGGVYEGTKPLAKGKTLPDGGRVATLLPEEYMHWRNGVIDAFVNELPPEERDQARKRLEAAHSAAGGAGYGNATEDLIQDADKGTGTYSETSPTFVALSILAFNDTDTGTTADDGSHIPTYTGYARKSTANTDYGASSAGSRSNANAIIFAACTAGSSTIVGMARCTASVLGRLIRYATTASTTVSVTQTPPQFAVGALVDTLD